MFAVVLVAVLPLLLVASVRAFLPSREQRPVLALLLAGYVVRLGIQVFSRELRLFSTPGADWETYQLNGELIARLWTYNGIHYVTRDELPSLARVSLPPNLFGFIFYLNGETTRLGGTGVIALLACLTCLKVYTIAIGLGAPNSTALKMLAFLLFMPTFLFYTSDMFKDGIVYFGIIVVIGSSLQLARRFSVTQLAVGICGLLCIWLTRYYLAYVLSIPLLIGCLGPASSSRLRAVVAVLVLAVAVGAVVVNTSIAGSAASDATETFERGTSREVVGSNAETGGSGVTFDDGGSVFSSMPAKFLYTLFSPFPWQAGSAGLQLAKLEALVWYFLAYRAVLAARLLWRERRTDFLIVLSFVGPTTFVYALMFANIGLNIRERIPIVIACAMLATVSWRLPVHKDEMTLAETMSPARL
jgi:hypothetical protein